MTKEQLHKAIQTVAEDLRISVSQITDAIVDIECLKIKFDKLIDQLELTVGD